MESHHQHHINCFYHYLQLKIGMTHIHLMNFVNYLDFSRFLFLIIRIFHLFQWRISTEFWSPCQMDLIRWNILWFYWFLKVLRYSRFDIFLAIYSTFSLHLGIVFLKFLFYNLFFQCTLQRSHQEYLSSHLFSIIPLHFTLPKIFCTFQIF